MAKNFVPISIDDLEETAKQEKDSCASYRIKGKCLEVEYMLDKTFRYRYDRQIILRDDAIDMLGFQT